MKKKPREDPDSKKNPSSIPITGYKCRILKTKTSAYFCHEDIMRHETVFSRSLINISQLIIAIDSKLGTESKAKKDNNVGKQESRTITSLCIYYDVHMINACPLPLLSSVQFKENRPNVMVQISILKPFKHL